MKNRVAWFGFAVVGSLMISPLAFAASGDVPGELMTHWAGILSLVIFVVAYALVISEETIHLRKSKPVMVAAGVIWFLVAVTYSGVGESELVGDMVRHGLLEHSDDRRVGV